MFKLAVSTLIGLVALCLVWIGFSVGLILGMLLDKPQIDALQARLSALEHPPIVASPSPSPQGTPEVRVR